MKMKIMTSLVLVLLLAKTGEAHKLLQRVFIRDDEENSEDIDADDQDITDGPLKNETDLQTYQQTFLNENKSVKHLNQFAEKAKKDQMEA